MSTEGVATDHSTADALTADATDAHVGPTCDANAATGYYCAGDKVTGGVTGTLYFCNGPGSASVAEVCARGCVVAPAGQDDHCAPDAPTCDADAATGYYCAGDKVTGGDADTLYHCTGPGAATVAQQCGHGCFVAAAGQDDYCATAATTAAARHAPNLANTVEVRHSDGTIALYMHISTSSVSTGQHVNQGQEVAKSGNTGWSTGPHLHNQVQTNCGSWWCQSLEFDFVEAPALTTSLTVTSQNCP